MNNRAIWIAKIQEYDLAIKPTNLVRGKGLCKLIAENDGICEKIDEAPVALLVGLIDPWFFDITYFLTYGECPSHLNPKERRNLRLKANKYVISQGTLFKRGVDGTFLRCVDGEPQKELLKTFHDEACGGHYSSTIMVFKIL